MTKVTIHETQEPSLEPKPQQTVITDSRNRKITIQQPSLLDESRLVRVMGEAAMNAAYFTGYAMPAAMVINIDGTPRGFPRTQLQIDAALQSLGREGLSAVMAHLIADADKGEEAADAIKKSQTILDSEKPAG